MNHDNTEPATIHDGPPAPPPVPPAAGIAAWVAAWGELAEPLKAGKAVIGPNRNYTYVTLTDILAAIRPVFARHGLMVTQTVVRDGDIARCTTTVWHTSGWTYADEPNWNRCASGPQDFGSVATYLKKYALLGLFGLAGAEDDDGATAQQRPHAPSHATTDDLPPVDPETGEILSEPPSRPRNTPGGAPTPKHKATRNQIGLIHGLLAEAGVDSKTPEGREQGLQMLASFARIDGPLATSKDLTTAQASMVIDELKALTAGKPS